MIIEDERTLFAIGYWCGQQLQFMSEKYVAYFTSTMWKVYERKVIA